MRPVIDLTGKKFGRLTVIKRAEDYIAPNGWFTPQWLCKCDCGKTSIVRGQFLKRGSTQSCGCLQEETLSYIHEPIHGDVKKTSKLHSLYCSWKCMLTRCHNPNRRTWKNYGGRGINVCNEWKGPDGYINFREWSLTNGWQKGLTIDRIDNNGNYKPDNCRWTTAKEQARNRRSNIWLNVDGKRMLLYDVAKKFGLWHQTIRYWMKKYGPEIAIQKAKER